MPEVIARFSTNDMTGIGVLDEAIGKLEPGDQVTLDMPLDPEIAVDELYDDFVSSTNEINNELFAEGLLPWPEESDIAFLIWDERIVHLRFTVGAAIPPRDKWKGTDWIKEQEEADSGIFRYREQSVPASWGIVPAVFGRLVASAGRVAMRNPQVRAIVAKHGYKAAPVDDLARMTTAQAQKQFGIAQTAMAAEQRIVIQQGRAGVAGALAGLLNIVRSLWPLGALIFIAIAPGKFIDLILWFLKDVVWPVIDIAADTAADVAANIGKNLKEALGPIIPYVLGGGLILFGGSYLLRSR